MFHIATAPPAALSTRPGTYALLLHMPRAARIQIGKLGTFDFPRGYYVYIGSAHAGGGLCARVMRHWRETKKLHWHVDYLRAAAKPVRVWSSVDTRDDECVWANTFANHPHSKIVAPRFGASDCACAAHLFYFKKQAMIPFPGTPSPPTMNP